MRKTRSSRICYDPKLLRVFALVRLNRRVATGLCGGVGGQSSCQALMRFIRPGVAPWGKFHESLGYQAH